MYKVQNNSSAPLVRRKKEVNTMDIIKSIEHEQLKNTIPDLKVGNTVRVHVKIKEGNKERIQVFEGIIIKKQGGGVNATFTVRKISYGVGVEKTFLIHSPLVEKVEVVRVGKARRAKLYYLRNRTGKAAKTKENVGAKIESKYIDVKEDLTEAVEETSQEETVDEEENYDTGDASLDNIRNQDEIGEQELLVLSFGTSYNDSRRLTVGAIENDLEKAFPDFSVRRGFTSNIIIDHVNKRDNVLIDDVDAAMNRAVDNGVKTLVVQPTHLMHGLEYDELVKEVGNYADAFDQVVFGEPLLSSDDDFAKVEKAITEWTADYDDGKTAICFMGHGTEADSNEVYQKMQDLLTKDGYANYFVGTVEATPSLEDVLAKVQAGDYERVVLEPLMVVAGDHANNDMAGDEDGSWKKTFEDAGYQVECLVRGLGENEAIRQIYVEHAQAAIDSLAKD
mgnify:CR=1 FL=1